jgi:predicted O-methyltransferase YrrM
MTTNNELCFLDTWARYSYTGSGRIVDLGCWLGATALALAQGVAGSAHARRDQPIVAYDRFVWEQWMTDVTSSMNLPWRFRPGDDFYFVAENLLRPYRALVSLHRGDLLEVTPCVEPIEFLFIDAMKSWPLADRIIRGYFPQLIPGRALVVQQDFTWIGAVTATNHLVMWLLRDYFQCVYHVPGSTSVVYFCTAPVDAASLKAIVPERFTLDDIHAAWEHSLRCVSPEGMAGSLLCKVSFLTSMGYSPAAHAECAAFASRSFRLPEWLLLDALGTLAQRRGNTADSSEATLLWESEQLLRTCIA